jgi:hypothetical protein
MKSTKLLLAIALTFITNSTQAESVVSKQDTDNIFRMHKAEWNNNAEMMVHPNGSVKLKELETGTLVSSIDNSSGYGLTIQPVYKSDNSSPELIVIGSYYPLGTFQDFEEVKKDIEKDAENDLNGEYNVTASLVRKPPLEAIELSVTKKSEK